MPEWHQHADAAFTRMRKAVKAGKGVRISAEELAQINLTSVGELIAQYDEEEFFNERSHNPTHTNLAGLPQGGG